MLSLDQAELQLADVTRKYDKFKKIFSEFANQVKGFDCQKPGDRSGTILGLTTDLEHLDKGYFTITILEQKLLYLFKMEADTKGMFNGKIECYLEKDFPKHEYWFIKGFTFKGTGETDIREVGGDGDIICLNRGYATFYIISNCILETIPKNSIDLT